MLYFVTKKILHLVCACVILCSKVGPRLPQLAQGLRIVHDSFSCIKHSIKLLNMKASEKMVYFWLRHGSASLIFPDVDKMFDVNFEFSEVHLIVQQSFLFAHQTIWCTSGIAKLT